MKGKLKVAGVATAGVLALAGAAYLSTMPSDRRPGGRLGGTAAPPPADWRTVDGERLMQLKVGGFPPFVVNVWYVGSEHGVITATAPDNGYWGRRTRANPDARIRIGDAVYDVTAREVHDPRARRDMLARYVEKYGLGESSGMTLDALDDPEGPWEVFFWTPR